MKIDKEQFKKMFPHLAKDLEAKEHRIAITSVRSDLPTGEKAAAARVCSLSDYSPDVVAFIQRCDTPEQAKEIIDYLERCGEITHEYSERLKKQLRERGLRSFGKKREPGYYFRKYYRPLNKK